MKLQVDTCDCLLKTLLFHVGIKLASVLLHEVFFGFSIQLKLYVMRLYTTVSIFIQESSPVRTCIDRNRLSETGSVLEWSRSLARK